MPIALALAAILVQTPTWEIKKMGKGGETTVATDDEGSVFLTCHLPCDLHISRDWGATFAEKHSFPEGLGDMHVVPYGEGRLQLTYMINTIQGIRSYYSTDNGKTMKEGAVLSGELDREWIAVNPITNQVFMNYSDGYIGGPKSKGIFLAVSNDGGRFFNQIARVDAEPDKSYAVDPYLVNTPSGKLYAAYAVSTDYDTIDSYKFCYSVDGGKNWKGHQTIATTHGDLGDTQERWMLGGLTCFGEDKIVAYYQDYEKIEVDGKVHQPLLTYTRISNDGGKTFGPATPIIPKAEIEDAIREVRRGKLADRGMPFYIQTLPWIAPDPEGNFHCGFVDGRGGQRQVDNRIYLNRWQVRYTRMGAKQRAFGKSEPVSKEWVSRRPPLDFNSCAADSKYVYLSWTVEEGSKSEWDFSGDLFFARKARK